MRAAAALLIVLENSTPGPVVTMLPDGELMAGGFTAYVAAGTKNGGLSPVSKREQSIRLPAATIAALQEKPFLFHAEVLLGKGENILSVGVVDRLSKHGRLRERLRGRSLRHSCQIRLSVIS